MSIKRLIFYIQNREENDRYVKAQNAMSFGSELHRDTLTERYMQSDMAVYRAWIRLSDYKGESNFVDGDFRDIYDNSGPGISKSIESYRMTHTCKSCY